LQDFAENDFEMRMFVIDGKIVHRVYSNFAWTDDDGYLRDFVVKERHAAIQAWMSGDEASMASAEKQAADLASAWLVWLRAQSVEALPAMRMDILVKRTGAGRAEVFTLELTELGFSMLGVPQLPALVFGALLQSCFEDLGPSPEEAKRVEEGCAMLRAKAGVSKEARNHKGGERKPTLGEFVGGEERSSKADGGKGGKGGKGGNGGGNNKGGGGSSKGEGGKSKGKSGSAAVCHAFQRGECSRGDSCRFAHVSLVSGA
jgi:uncharacterized membrane protein YgcG